LKYSAEKTESHLTYLTQPTDLGQLNTVTTTQGLYFDTKNKKVVEYHFTEIAEAHQKLSILLSLYLLGQTQALLLNAALGEKAYKETKPKGKAKAKPKAKPKAAPDAEPKTAPEAVPESRLPSCQLNQDSFELFWQDPNNAFCLGNDPYMHFFWPHCPQLVEHEGLLESIYQDIYAKVSSETKADVSADKKAGSK
jgi:exodeoxyribonuclease V gamma subunit